MNQENRCPPHVHIVLTHSSAHMDIMRALVLYMCTHVSTCLPTVKSIKYFVVSSSSSNSLPCIGYCHSVGRRDGRGWKGVWGGRG